MPPVNSCAKELFSFWHSCISLMPAGLMPCRLIHNQNPPNSAGDTSGRPAVSPCSSLIIPCNWKGREEFYLFFWSLNQLSQCPEVSLGCPCTCCNFYCCQLEKSVMDKNPRVVPGSFLFTASTLFPWRHQASLESLACMLGLLFLPQGSLPWQWDILAGYGLINLGSTS